MNDAIASADNTAAVTLFLGANDASLKDLNPKQHVPLEEYKENLIWLTNRYAAVVGFDLTLDLDPVFEYESQNSSKLYFGIGRLITKVGDKGKVILIPAPPSDPEAWEPGWKSKSVDK